MEQSTALIYAVGVFGKGDRDRNPKVLRRLARATGGSALFPTKINDVPAICASIARDIRSQYTISYQARPVTIEPSGKRQGGAGRQTFRAGPHRLIASEGPDHHQPAGRQAIMCCTRRRISDLGCIPTMRSTSRPRLNTNKAGMLSIRKRAAVTGFSSTLSFRTRILPSSSPARFSITGVRIRQGAPGSPHVDEHRQR